MQAFGIITAMDTWTAFSKSEGITDLDKITPPSESPDRKQALAITCTGQLFKKGILIDYERKDGKIIWGEETEMHNYEDMNFGSLFQRKFDA